MADSGRRVTKKTTVTDPSGAVREYFESVRMYSKQEMVEMLHRAGLTDIRIYGALDREPLGPESKRLIAVCKKG